MGYTSFPVKENLGHKYGYQSDERNLKMSAPLHISRNIVTEVPLKSAITFNIRSKTYALSAVIDSGESFFE